MFHISSYEQIPYGERDILIHQPYNCRATAKFSVQRLENDVLRFKHFLTALLIRDCVYHEEDIHKIKRRSKQRKEGETKTTEFQLSLAKNPTEPKKTLVAITLLHDAPGFLGALKLFLNF